MSIAVDYNDPLSLLLAAEGADDECDIMHSFWDAMQSRSTPEVERDRVDMLGASPFEIENPTYH